MMPFMSVRTFAAQKTEQAPVAKTTTVPKKTTSSDQAPTPPAVPQPPDPVVVQAPTSTSEPFSVPIDPQMIALQVERIALSFFFTMGFIIVGLPIARAWARRMDRRNAGADPRAIPADLTERLTRIEQAVESISVEVERVAEGQRFTTKLLAEQNTPAALSAKERM